MTSDYESEMLIYAINLHLNRILDRGSLEANLLFINNDINIVVYGVAKRLYQEIGIRVGFASIRDLVINHKNYLEREIHLEKQRIQREAIDKIERERRDAIWAAEREKQKIEERAKRERRHKLKIENRLSEAEVRSEKESIFAKLKGIVAEQLSVDAAQVIIGASFYNDLNADELDATEIIMALEEEFDVEIPDEDAEEIRTMKDALEYLYLRV